MQAFPGGYAPSPSGPVAVGNACTVLEKWNGRDTLDARGAILFRRFWTRVTAVGRRRQASTQQTPIWTTPFSTSDPVNTPRGLNIANPHVQKAFGDALKDLAGAKIAVDAPLGQYQKDLRPTAPPSPYHGGPGTLGVFNALTAAWDPSRGTSVRWGTARRSSRPCRSPATAALMRGRSSRTRSRPTRRASTTPTRAAVRQGRWVTDRFCARDVANATLTTRHLRG